MSNPFPAILRRKKKEKKKVHMATKPRGGGAKRLSGRTTKKRTFFCGFPDLLRRTRLTFILPKERPLKLPRRKIIICTVE